MTVMVRLRTIVWTMTAMLLGAAIAAVLLSAWRAEAAPGDEDSTFVPVPPCRLFDFRPAPDNVGPKSTPLGPGEANVHTQQVTGTNGNCTIPADAVGVSMNVTIVNPTAQSNLRVFPADVATPLASNLNWLPGQSPTPNKVDVKLSAGGAIKLFNQNGTVNLLGDVIGYYTNSTLVEIEERLSALENDGDGSEAAVLARVAALEQAVDDQQAEIDALRSQNDDQQDEIDALEAKLADVSVLEVGGERTVRFSGVNVQVVDGSGDSACNTTGFEDCNRSGNLIVGYNEDTSPASLRLGSHNLIVGTGHSYRSHSGIVAGERNTISGEYATVTGGSSNTASGTNASVTGGNANTASDAWASVSGGSGNTANERWSSVSGGSSNTASGNNSSVSGGTGNTADGGSSSVSGGSSNTADGNSSSVSGGTGNTADGFNSAVSGGANRDAANENQWVAGSLSEAN